MAAANPEKVRKGQQGTVFRATIKDDADDSVVDVSNASVKKIKAKDPDGNTIEKTASFTTDGTDGKVEYQDDAADFTAAEGTWTYWGYVELPGGFQGDSTPLTYVVQKVGA